MSDNEVQRQLTPTEIMKCAVWYFNCTPIQDQYEAASRRKWDELSSAYQQEKVQDYNTGMAFWFGRFDEGRKKAWVNAAITRYGGDVRCETALLDQYREVIG